MQQPLLCHVFSLNVNLIGLIQDQTTPVAYKKSVDIDVTIEDFECRFRSLHEEILHLLIKNGVDTLTVINSLTMLPVKLRKEYEKAIKDLGLLSFFSKKESMNKLFFHLNPLFSFLDYGLLEYIIKLYGSDTLKQDMTTYSSDMCIFMKETTIKQLIDHLPGQTEIPPKFSVIEAKIGEDASKCTLELLNRIRKRYCSEVKLSEIVFHLVAVVEANSFIVKWIVPSAIAEDIMKPAKSINQGFYQEYKITSLTLDGMWLYMSEAELEAMWLHVNDTKLCYWYTTIHKQIVIELKLRKISAKELSQWLMHQQLNIPESVINCWSQELTNRDYFPLVVVDFEFLSMFDIIIEKFGSDCLNNVTRLYSSNMPKFTRCLTV